ncbi:unnamed protein product [Prunus armeniaca]
MLSSPLEASTSLSLLEQHPRGGTVTTPFLIIDCPTAYNVILGSLAMAQMKVFISTHMAQARCATTNLVPEAAMLQQSNPPIANIGARPS